MNTKLWFRAKRYGYGWTPCTWEGWLTLGIYIVFFLIGEKLFFVGLTKFSSNRVTIVLILYILTITSLLILVARKKGEPARWRWGK